MNTSFSVGPWFIKTYEDGTIPIFSPAHRMPIASVQATVNAFEDACLIATAPEMYKALKAALPCVKDAVSILYKDEAAQQFASQIINQMETAISKAEGKLV